MVFPASPVDGEKHRESDIDYAYNLANKTWLRQDIDTTNFDKVLSPTDNTIQKALEKIDEISVGGGGGLSWDVPTGTAQVTTTDGTAQILDLNAHYTISLPAPGSLTPGYTVRYLNVDGFDYVIEDSTGQTLASINEPGDLGVFTWTGTRWSVVENFTRPGLVELTGTDVAGASSVIDFSGELGLQQIKYAWLFLRSGTGRYYVAYSDGANGFYTAFQTFGAAPLMGRILILGRTGVWASAITYKIIAFYL